MIIFAIVNKNTGEIEADCGLCGIVSTTSYEVFRDYPAVDENHAKYLLDPKQKEHIKMAEIDPEKGRYKRKVQVDNIDTKRRVAKGRLIDR